MNDDQNDLRRRLEALAKQTQKARLPSPAAVRRASERRRRHRQLTLASAVAAVAMAGIAFGVSALASPPGQRVNVTSSHVPSTTTTTTRPNTAPRSSSTTTTPSTTTTTTSPSTTTVPPATVDRAIEVYGDCQTPSLEPASIILTCADAGVVVQDLHWSSWTASGAVAVGTLVYNDCTPSCAEGHFHDVPDTTITLSVPVKDPSGQLVWSEIQENPEPPGYQTGPYHGGPQPLPTQPD